MMQDQVRNLIPFNKKHFIAKARQRLVELERMLTWHSYSEHDVAFFEKEIKELLLMVKPHQEQ